MDDAKLNEFIRMLTKCMAAYSKPLPESDILTVWVEMLGPYSLRQIGLAFVSYMDANDTFEPKPVSIANRCKLNDGRLGVEEAWAIALTSQDEAETVVWTQEMAQAFALCKPVLDAGDEVGARMSFKETYVRLVTEARLNGVSVKWTASIGWDVNKRSAALKKASVAGFLSAPIASMYLPAPQTKKEELNQEARAQLAKVKQMLIDSHEQKMSNISKKADEDRAKTNERKKEIENQVMEHSR
jgi:hypothetical protein